MGHFHLVLMLMNDRIKYEINLSLKSLDACDHRDTETTGVTGEK